MVAKKAVSKVSYLAVKKAVVKAVLRAVKMVFLSEKRLAGMWEYEKVVKMDLIKVE